MARITSISVQHGATVDSGSGDFYKAQVQHTMSLEEGDDHREAFECLSELNYECFQEALMQHYPDEKEKKQ